MHLDAVKVGMVASLDNVGVILEAVERFHLQNLIFDPVMISSSGASLLWEGSSSDGFKQLNLGDPLKERALRTGILNLAKASTLFTPNLIEAEYLLATRIQNLEDMQEAAHALINMGLRAVLVKGGHLELGSAEESASIATQGGSYPISSSHSNSSLVPGNSFVCDVFLARGSSPQVFKSRKVESLNLHGTGCTLSSAIATYLAKGFELSAAIERGRAYLIQAIEQSVGLQVLESSTSSRRSDQAYYSGPLNHGFSPLPTDLTGLGSK
jgi:hydroxymethylpyrimidine/phosphomethylpyrimidine kinase